MQRVIRNSCILPTRIKNIISPVRVRFIQRPSALGIDFKFSENDRKSWNKWGKIYKEEFRDHPSVTVFPTEEMRSRHLELYLDYLYRATNENGKGTLIRFVVKDGYGLDETVGGFNVVYDWDKTTEWDQEMKRFDYQSWNIHEYRMRFMRDFISSKMKQIASALNTVVWYSSSVCVSRHYRKRFNSFDILWDAGTRLTQWKGFTEGTTLPIIYGVAADIKTAKKFMGKYGHFIQCYNNGYRFNNEEIENQDQLLHYVVAWNVADRKLVEKARNLAFDEKHSVPVDFETANEKGS